MQARSAERHQRPVTAHRRAGVSHLASDRRFTQRWTRRPRRGEFAGGDLGHNKPPRPHSLKLYTRDCTGRDPVTARGVDQATCRVIVVRHVLGCKYDVRCIYCPGPGPRPPVEPLSGSELRVLRYLPTNLTTPEIAAELYVSHTAHESAAFGVHVLAGAGGDVRRGCRAGMGSGAPRRLASAAMASSSRALWSRPHPAARPA